MLLYHNVVCDIAAQMNLGVSDCIQEEVNGLRVQPIYIESLYCLRRISVLEPKTSGLTVTPKSLITRVHAVAVEFSA